MAIKLTKCILLEFAPIMPVFCSLSLLLPSCFSKNYAGKIGLTSTCVDRSQFCVYVICNYCTVYLIHIAHL